MFRRELRLFISSIYWVFIPVILFFVYNIAIDTRINMLEGYEYMFKLNFDFVGEYINIYNVIGGIYYSEEILILPLSILLIIILSSTSVLYYIDEKKGYINFEYLRINKNKYLFSKVLINSLIIGILFVLPALAIFILKSFDYSFNLPEITNYNLPNINNIDLCLANETCKDKFSLLDQIYFYKYPYFSLIINVFIRPFLMGFIFSFTLMTFSLIFKRKSVTMLVTSGYIVLLNIIYVLSQTIPKKITTTSDNLSEFLAYPYAGLFLDSQKSNLWPVFTSVIFTLILIVIIFIVFRRINKNEN